MKIVKIFILLSLLLALLPNYVDAHPGRTDKNGGHHCWTNCAKWGLEYGEYHYHNGSGAKSSSSNTVKKSVPSSKENQAQKAKEAAAKKEKQIAQAEQDGYNDGLRDGYNSTSDIGTSNYQGAYNKGYKKGLEKGIAKLTNEKNKAYRAGYDAALKGKTQTVPSVYKKTLPF